MASIHEEANGPGAIRHSLPPANGHLIRKQTNTKNLYITGIDRQSVGLYTHTHYTAVSRNPFPMNNVSCPHKRKEIKRKRAKTIPPYRMKESTAAVETKKKTYMDR